MEKMVVLAEENLELKKELQEKDDRILDLDEENKMMHEDIQEL